MVKYFFLLLLTAQISTAYANTDQKEAYKLSMENDAQFIEAVGSLFNGLANLQRTITQELKWEGNNTEHKKLMKAVDSFKNSRQHLALAISNSDLLLSKLTGEKKKRFGSQLATFKSKLSDLDSRLESIVKKIEGKKLPDRKFIHDTISQALAGVGFGMDVAKSKPDPGKEN